MVENTYLWESKQNLIMNEVQWISPSWPGPIIIVNECLLLFIRTLGSQLHNKSFVSSKNYKIFGISALTSSCNNVFYCLEKEGVNLPEAKMMKAFNNVYGYMWIHIWQIPLLKDLCVCGSNGLPLFLFLILTFLFFLLLAAFLSFQPLHSSEE